VTVIPDIAGHVQVDETGAAASGIRVQVWRLDPSFGLLPHGETTTSAAGDFTTSYSRIGAMLLGGQHIHLRLKDRVGRTVWKSPDHFMDPFGSDWALGTIRIRQGNLSGWRVTGLAASGAPSLISTDNAVALMIDNAEAWRQLRDEVDGAQTSIHLQLFYFDIGKVFLAFSPDPPALGAPTAGTRLEDRLIAVNTGATDAEVRLLIRSASLAGVTVGYPTTTAAEVEAHFASRPGHTVEVRRFATDPRLPMHAKFAVFDGGKAHIMGSPLLQEYFDAASHVVDDRRRGPWRGLRNAIKVPIHDVDVALAGGSVAHLDDLFRMHWAQLGGPAPPRSGAPPAGGGNASTVQIVRSLPGGTFPGLPDGEMGVLEAYQRAFALASRYVYLENQYVNNWDILETIRRALRTNPALQVIVLLNSKVDIPGYQTFQDMRLTQLKRDLTADGTANRLGLFTLWIHDATTTPQRIVRCYVHSKVAVVDDAWATAGSANLDGVSLHTGEHMVPLTHTPASEHDRAVEVNAVVYDGLDGAGPSAVPRDLRQRLWGEHFGLAPSDPALATAPAGGWLQLWRDAAAAKLAGLCASPPTGYQARILEWRPEGDPKRFLRAAGVKLTNFDASSEVRSFDFATGNWE